MLKVAKPDVIMVGYTSGTNISNGIGMFPDPDATSAEGLMEAAGRVCYQSQHKPNEATETNKAYLANILRQGHESVLEHAVFSFYLTGVSRALTHELIRHRHLSYSQLSQRFVNESQTAIVLPPAIEEGSLEHDTLDNSVQVALWAYEDLVNSLQDEHELKRKQAREAARAVLPNCVETRIIVTGNVRAWRDMLKKRLDPAADAEIRLVSQMIYDELHAWVGNALQDFEGDI